MSYKIAESPLFEWREIQWLAEVRHGRPSAKGRFQSVATQTSERQLLGAKPTLNRNFPLQKFDSRLLRMTQSFYRLEKRCREGLKTATSRHWWTAELRFGIDLSERPRSLHKMDRHKPAIQLRCRIAVSNQYFSNSSPIFTTSLSRSWICCRSEVISWSEKAFSGGSPSIMILV